MSMTRLMGRTTFHKRPQPYRTDRNCWACNCLPAMFAGIAVLPSSCRAIAEGMRKNRLGCRNFRHRLAAAKSRPKDNAFDILNPERPAIALVRLGVRPDGSNPDRSVNGTSFSGQSIPGAFLLRLTRCRKLPHPAGCPILPDDLRFAQNLAPPFRGR